MRRIFLVSLAWNCHGWKYSIFHMEDVEIRARGCISETSPDIFLIPLGPFTCLILSCHFVGGCVLDLQEALIKPHHSYYLLFNWKASAGYKKRYTPRDTILIPFSTEQQFVIHGIFSYPLVETHGNF